MNLLVDSHVLIWMSSQPNRLSAYSIEVLEDAANTVSASLLVILGNSDKNKHRKIRF